MSVITLAADSTTLIINDHGFTTFAEGDFLTITPPNAATSRVNSATGGVTISGRLDKDVRDVVVRVQKYGVDDVFMQGILNAEETQVLEGSAKESYTMDGTPSVESWTLEAGSMTTQPTQTKNNQDGNAMMEYTMQFRTAKRSL